MGLGFLQELTIGFYKRVPFKGFLESFFKVSGLGALVALAVEGLGQKPESWNIIGLMPLQ